MSNPDIVYTDSETASTSTFDPTEQQAAFVAEHGPNLTINNAKIFFIRAAKAKTDMAKRQQAKIKILFGTLELELVNNHRPAATQSVVQDHELTLHRVSGYLAKWLLDQHKASASRREAIVTVVINPISAKMGLTWTNGPEIYLSTLPGTEMFLDDFKLYPLAFILIRIKRGEIPEVLAKKALRQRYAGKTSSTWMTTDITAVKAALAQVERIKPVYSGLAATMTRFLEEVGVKQPSGFFK
ncbi:nucleocapsid protein [Baakal virus]|uniref:Nucleoprotein n=1 Tax=Baakal virus TaxID=2609058 RepID=A0A5C2D2J5_9VIRU|nr:nucleocapsid protein [Baakal virus]QEO75950.1 nucleocapsid protein [Baakal virus]